MYFTILLLTLVGTYLYWVCNKLKHWQRLGVKQDNIFSLLRDVVLQFVRPEGFPQFVEKVYSKRPHLRYSGIYQVIDPLFVAQDPELIKKITIKDFDHFIDHVPFMPDENDILWSKNLFALTGDKWRNMRTTLSPAFTSSKMRSMFVLMSDCAQQYTNYFIENANDRTVEFKDIFTRYANDVIATCSFGLKCDSLRERNNEFYLMGREATDFSGFWKNFGFILMFICPKLAKLLGLSMFNKRVSEFFTNLVTETIKLREEKNIIRPDMIHLLMQARKDGLTYEENHDSSKETGFATVEESEVTTLTRVNKQNISDLDITAQCLIFFFAGFETVSTLMSFVAFELGVNPDIQEKLIDEIDESLETSNGKLTYEALNKMKYLDMVVAETLRKWPSNLATDRRCHKPYTIPAENPDETDVHLQTGTAIWIPTFGIHRNPKFYPNPEKFDPERFNEENKHTIDPYAYLPFGLGPRNCIGSRFALLETKTIIYHLLSKFTIEVIDKSPIPLILSDKGFTLNSKTGFWFKLEKRGK